jgi:serine phosphatase RsbU (regulator of sigma subunit)
LSVTSFAALAVLVQTDTLRPLDHRCLDVLYRIRGERAASDSIAIIEIDAATVNAYRGPTLPRDAYSLLIKALEDAGVSAIGLDVLFIGESSNADHDQLLATVTSQYRNIVNAFSFPQSFATHSAQAERRSDGAEPLHARGIHDTLLAVPIATAVSMPYSMLLEASESLGHVNIAVDSDGGIRRVPLLMRFEGNLYPALSLALYWNVLGARPPERVEAAKDGYYLRDAGQRRFFVPLDEEGGTSLSFAGNRAAFRHAHSMIDVLRAYASGDREGLRRDFEGRIALIGSTAATEAAGDVGITPFATQTPLVFVHANALNALLRSEFLRQASLGIVALGGFLLAAILGWFLPRLSMPKAAGVAASCALLTAGLDFALFAAARLELPHTACVLLAPAVFVVLATSRLLFAERRVSQADKDLAAARKIQAALLPKGPPDLPGLDIYGVNFPAEGVGGDYYDWIIVDDTHLAVAVGDVCGKGLPAAMLMSHLRASFHELIKGSKSPGAVIGEMHASLFQATDPTRFATFFLGVLSANGGDELVYSNAGHNPGFLARNGQVAPFNATGQPLGLLEHSVFVEARSDFLTGDILILYSDGITECRRGDLLYGEARLQVLVSELSRQELSAKQIGREILHDVHAFSNGGQQDDDITLVVVKRIA